LTSAEVDNLIREVPMWHVAESPTAISRTFRFKSFRDAVAFVNLVANLAEEEGHHPDITINYRKVTFTLTTHAIGGLSENDFILAAKIDRLNLQYSDAPAMKSQS
jgi:4a-hydroxytetrahydrobiopterin dehydratase